MRALLRNIVCLTMFASAANATTYTTDLSDLWYNRDESGWGVNVVQQAEILFMTFFLYNASGQPVWYVAPATANTSGFVFSGPLYQTAGPWFGGAFNPNNVTNRQVGTATFTGQAVETATLSYTVDGVQASKNIVRQTWRANNLTGEYIGAAIGTYSSGCTNSGYAEEAASISVTHSGTSLRIVANGPTGGSCAYVSTNYGQFGRMGNASGGEACTGGANATFTAFEIEGSISAFTARANVNFGSGCTWSGRIGGLRRGS